MKILLLFLLLSGICFSAFSQKSEKGKGCGSATVVISDNMTKETAKNIALVRAKDDAFVQVFGENLSNIQVLKADGQNENFTNYTTEISQQYEWLENSKEPRWEISTDPESGQQVVMAEVCGVFRKIVNEQDIDFHVFANDNVEKRDFLSGDTVGVSIKSAQGGYVAVFSEEESGYAYCWLPYSNDNWQPLEIKQNKEYRFLGAGDPPYMDFLKKRKSTPLILITDQNAEIVKVWLVFSPTQFALPAMTYDAVNDFYYLTADALQNWYGKSAIQNSQFCKRQQIVTIRKK